MPSRQRFFVELKEEDTTVVSWKKLVSEAEGPEGFGEPSEAPAGANPALEARIAPEKTAGPLEDPLSQGPNRFNSVIERIERLYKGGDSDDDRAEDSPDEDQYNTDDSFIDDEELNEYFMVENAKTKHSGFFINRGALEKVNVPTPVPVPQPKKRKRRELKKDKKDETEGKRRIKGRIKAAARQFHSQLDPLGGSEVQINREHDALIRIQPSETEELSSGSDAFLQGPGGSSRNYNLGKRELQGIEKNGGNGEGHLEVNIPLNTESVFGETRNVQNRSEYRYGSSADEKKRNEASREPKGVMKVSDSLKMKMMQQSAREDGTRDSDGGAGKAGADYTQKSLSPGPKEPSPGRRGWPKGTVMERAIQDLIKIVSSLCPVSAEGEGEDQPSNAGSKTKRLPREVKTRLAKVARLAAKQGKVPDELIERLHGILGHIMRPNTLKRNLKEMVEHGNLAKQEKEGRLLDIKREVTEMVRNRVTSLQFQGVEAREGSSDDFQAGSLPSKKASTSVEKYKWDHAIEDLLCNLYEQYLEGMDEHKGPQIRKLYVELAELWPEGWMDNNGIKAAVFRAKERKKRLSKLNKEPRKRKAGSCDTLRAEDDLKDGSVGRLLKYSGSHSLEELLPKRGDDSTPEDENVFLRGTSQQAWRPTEKVHKHKQHFGGVVKSSLKANKVEHEEKSRQNSEELREHLVYEKNPLLKKKRKKPRAGSEGEITTSPLLFGTPIGPRQDVDLSKDPIVHDEPLDDALLRSR